MLRLALLAALAALCPAGVATAVPVEVRAAGGAVYEGFRLARDAGRAVVLTFTLSSHDEFAVLSVAAPHPEDYRLVAAVEGGPALRGVAVDSHARRPYVAVLPRDVQSGCPAAPDGTPRPCGVRVRVSLSGDAPSRAGRESLFAVHAYRGARLRPGARVAGAVPRRGSLHYLVELGDADMPALFAMRPGRGHGHEGSELDMAVSPAATPFDEVFPSGVHPSSGGGAEERYVLDPEARPELGAGLYVVRVEAPAASVPDASAFDLVVAARYSGDGPGPAAPWVGGAAAVGAALVCFAGSAVAMARRRSSGQLRAMGGGAGGTSRAASEAELSLLQRREVAAEGAADAPECAICLARPVEGDTVATLPCAHRYHDACIARWLARRRTCPLCKQDLATASDIRGATAGAAAGLDAVVIEGAAPGPGPVPLPLPGIADETLGSDTEASETGS